MPFWMTYWPRALLQILNLAIYCIIVRLCMVGVDLQNPEIGPIRKTLIMAAGKPIVRAQCLLAGVYSFKVEYVSTGEGDYRKWLGPDWQPEFEGASTLVSNHVCHMDILLAMSVFFPSFMSKESVRNYPFVGCIAVAIDCQFTDRAGGKDARQATAAAMQAR